MKLLQAFNLPQTFYSLGSMQTTQVVKQVKSFTKNSLSWSSLKFLYATSAFVIKLLFVIT